MFETSESSVNRDFDELHKKVDQQKDDEDCASLWSIDDDTTFYAQGLKHHSAGKGKSLYVTWDENYLLNFLFKTSSKAGTTTLTKVRIAMPVYNQQQEIISNTLILEMNSLLYMKSGNVYYFSSVKSMHRIDWLSGVRCMASCPPKQFSVIRLLEPADHDADQKRTLSLEVYKDVPQLGHRFGNDILVHSYDITFDLDNLFNCEWFDEVFTLTSLVVDQENIAFLQQLVAIGDILRTQQDITKLNINQELHIYAISGNVFILVGDIASEDELILHPIVDNFSIQLLSIYASPIVQISVDCKNNLLIVLMQSGCMDIWYKSHRMFGTLLHSQHEISGFLYYDFFASNIIFFTTPTEVVQLNIITNNSNAVEKECFVKETRKSLSGMTACTFVGDLQQLICLSINNIFYRINFATQLKSADNYTINSEANAENLNYLYALNAKRLNDLRAKAQVIDEIMEKPKYLHNAIEEEFQKQQTLTFESKREIFKDLFQCHLEYHAHLSGMEHIDTDFVHIKANFKGQEMNAESTIFCLIFISVQTNKATFIPSMFNTAIWYFHISYFEKYFQLHIPCKVLNNKLCIILDMPLEDLEKQLLPMLSLDLATFLKHSNHSLCLKYNLNLLINENTYINLFSTNVQNLKPRNSLDDIKIMLIKQSSAALSSTKLIKSDQNRFKLKERHKIPKDVFHNVMKKINTELIITTEMDIKIYFLHQYLVELYYDSTEEILIIYSNYSASVFYIKLLLELAVQSLYAIDDIGQPLDHAMQQMLVRCESMVLSDPDFNLFSVHLENLRNVYSKLRLEFYNMLR